MHRVSTYPPKSASVPLLVVADACALVAFVLLGIRSHHEARGLDVLLRNAIPLLIAWFGVAGVTHTYGRPGLRPVVATWAIAVPIALVVRTVLVGSPSGGDLVAFLAVGMGFTLVSLLTGRAVVTRLGRRSVRVR